MTKANESAFPSALRDVAIYQYINAGLTKRELFAAMAMQGLLSYKSTVFADVQENDKLVARGAVQYADALLKELERGTK